MSTNTGKLRDVENYVKGQIEAHRYLAELAGDRGDSVEQYTHTAITKALELVLKELQA